MTGNFSFLEFLLSALRLSTPLLFAAAGGLLSERSGVVNIALEGLMSVGAFSAGAMAALTSSAWLGLGGCLLVGAVFGFFFAFSTVVIKGDHIIMGTALNILCLGGLPIVDRSLFSSTSSTPALTYDQRLSVWLFFFVALFLLLALSWIFSKRPFGLRLRATGENREAARSLGLHVTKIQVIAVTFSGILAATGGAFLSIAHSSQYSRGMSAGRGFIALSAVILSGWRPLFIIPACLLFGIADAAQMVLQSTELPGNIVLPVQFIQMFPYVMTLLVLIGFLGKHKPPEDLGKNTS